MDAPERIFARFAATGPAVNIRKWSTTDFAEAEAAYIRADIVDQMVAEAVATERERCASVAGSKRNQFFGNGVDDWEAGFIAAIDSTTAAIREGVSD